MLSTFEFTAAIGLYFVQLIPALVALVLIVIFAVLLLRGEYAVALIVAGILGAASCICLGIAFLASNWAEKTAGAILLVGGVASLIGSAYALPRCRNGTAHGGAESPTET